MKTQRVLISGAGIAGPALAHALANHGFDVTVVERAAALREGGQAVDFRGPVHREVLERLDLWEAIHQHRTPGMDMILLDRAGAPLATLPSVMMSGDVEILRGTLSQLLHQRSEKTAAYRFDERVTGLEQTPDGVTVEFVRGKAERYDLVVGADGLHSGIRALAFGDEAQFLRYHGYRLATYSLPNVLGLRRRALTYTVPGRSVMVGCEGADHPARAQFIYAAEQPGGVRGGLEQEREALGAAYRDVGWEVPTVLAHLPQAADLFVDEISTIAIDRYSSGRVVLLGDAAYGGTLGGQGTPLAIVGAYVLAKELIAARGDLQCAFQRYEACLRPYATRCQKGAERAGPFFAPRTRFGLLCRNLFYRAFTSRLLIGQFEKMVKASATDFELPPYAAS